MKNYLLILAFSFSVFTCQATIHIIHVWDGYFQFIPTELTIHLGDTIQWLPLDQPSMSHTITSSDIPVGAESFDEVWEAPADTFFQYVPTLVGIYNYVCTPHAETYNMVGSFTVIDGANSVAEKEFDQVKLYPNPTYGLLSVQGVLTGTPYNIIAIDGKKIAEGKLAEKIDVLFLDPGYYFIRFQSESPKTIKFKKK